MEKTSDPSRQQSHDLVCPITLDVYRDPVLAGDGHIYERTAIMRWIEQQGTSPLTREPLNVHDLRSEKHIKYLCRSYRSKSTANISQTNTVASLSLSMTPSEAQTEQPVASKEYCNVKRTLVIIISISLIISPLIIATSVILFLVQSNPMPTISTIITSPSMTPILPNNCTLPTIVSLFSWKNVPSFNYRYYSTLYKATSTRTMITFAFRHDPSYWCLDNVSVIDIALKTELVINGHFENNPSNGFFRCNSYANSSTTLFLASPHPYNGKRSFCDGTVGLPDYLSQRLDTKIGQMYRVSFWLQNMGDVPNSAHAVMSYSR